VIVSKAGTTTSDSESTSDTPTWVWVVLGILAAAVIGLVVAFLTRRSGGLAPAERRRRLDHAIGTWAAQG
jgi:tetrahydromethanopterin S-methyltransferase subunit C